MRRRAYARDAATALNMEEILLDRRVGAEQAGNGGAPRRWPWSAFRSLSAGPRAKRRAVALRAFWRGGCLALRLAFDAPHHPAQSRRPFCSADRLSLSQPVPRRPDRRAHPEPGDAERDHRLRHRVLRDGRYRRHHRRSGKAAQTRARPILRRRRGDQAGAGVFDQSRPGRPPAAPAGFAHPHARPHLRRRRLYAARLPARSRRAPTFFATICRRRGKRRGRNGWTGCAI